MNVVWKYTYKSNIYLAGVADVEHSLFTIENTFKKMNRISSIYVNQRECYIIINEYAYIL